MLAILVGAPGQPERAAAQSSATRADLVRLPFPRDDGTLTPTTFERGYSLMTLVYDTLMLRDASGAPQPWLARSLRKSDGGRRITLRLRGGVRWHDGRPLTASDVAFTFDFVAARPHPRFTPQLLDVEQVKAVDRLTVEITLREPAPGFPAQPLADLPILPRHLWEDLPEGSPAARAGARAILLSGRVAEQTVLDDAGSGAADDLSRVTQVARQMVCDLGMSDALGALSYGHGANENGHSEETARVIDAETRKLVNEAEERSRRVLAGMRVAFDRVAEGLIEHETLSADAFRGLLDDGSGQSPARGAAPVG
ncbi:MAG: ABC transporter substrate-binding protein [Solirubrobacteraceae bacterium]